MKFSKKLLTCPHFTPAAARANLTPGFAEYVTNDFADFLAKNSIDPHDAESYICYFQKYLDGNLCCELSRANKEIASIRHRDDFPVPLNLAFAQTSGVQAITPTATYLLPYEDETLALLRFWSRYIIQPYCRRIAAYHDSYDSHYERFYTLANRIHYIGGAITFDRPFIRLVLPSPDNPLRLTEYEFIPNSPTYESLKSHLAHASKS